MNGTTNSEHQSAPVVFTFRLPPKSPLALKFAAARQVRAAQLAATGRTLPFTRTPRVFALGGGK